MAMELGAISLVSQTIAFVNGFKDKLNQLNGCSDWFEQPDSTDTLWIRGVPGKGKSVIAAFSAPLLRTEQHSPHNPEVTETKWVATGKLNGVPVDGCPDTGSCINAISYDFVQRQNWAFKKSSDLSPLKLPGNGISRPLGTIELPWAFDGESTKYNLVFHVLPKCVHPIILGRKFLKSSETLGKRFAHRIKKKIVNSLSLKRLFLIGSSHERSWGSFNGHSACAMADTGSDLMAVSSKFAKSLNLDIKTDSRYREWVELADGSTRRTKGTVLGAEWSFGGDTKYQSDFAVLDEIDCDVILSNDFLFDKQVLMEHDVFQSGPEAPFEGVLAYQQQLSLIKRIKPSCKDAPPSVQTGMDGEEEEHVRRANEEDRISALPQPDRNAAWVEEHRRRAEWDQRQHTLPSQTQLQPQPSPPPNAQTNHDPSRTNNSRPPTTPATSTARRKFTVRFWRK